MSSEEEYYDLSPDKRTLRSLQSDVTPITAVEELVDNVLDNWRRVGNDQKDITIDIYIDFDTGEFRIEDDSGGLGEEEVKQIFALGGSAKEQVPKSIGSYGMGAKKAILRLGTEAEIKSRTPDLDTAYGFQIDEEWLHSDRWHVEKRQFDDVSAGSTVIRISGLDIEFLDGDSQLDVNDESSTDSQQLDSEADESTEDTDQPGSEGSSFKTPEEYVSSLREDLAETYDEFLRGRAGPEDGSITIVVNGKRVKPESGVDWAYTPFDGYHPRWFQNYQISPDELPNREEPVNVDIIAGLTRTGSQADAGTDIIIQNRRILTSETGQMGGWGSGPYLPDFGPQRRRTRFKVKVTVENNPETLPWDTQKSRIEPNSVITDRIFNVLSRAGKEYANVTYDNLPTPYTKPFSKEHNTELDDSWQGIDEFDYSERSHFTDTPDTDRPLATQIESLVEYHKGELKVFAPHIVAEPYARAYRDKFNPNEEVNTDFVPEGDELWVVPEKAEKFPEQELHLFLQTIRNQAELHRRDGETLNFDEEEPWWAEYYKRVQQEDGTFLNDLDEEPEDDRIGELVRKKGENRDLPEPILNHPNLRLEGLTRVFSDKPESVDSTPGKQAQLEDISSEKGNSQEGTSPTEDDSDPSGTETSESQTAEKTGRKKGATKRSSEDREKENTQTEDEPEPNSEPESDTPNFKTSNKRSGVQKRLEDERSVIFMLKNHEYESICEAVGLDPNEASSKEVGEAILEQGIDIRRYRGTSTNGA